MRGTAVDVLTPTGAVVSATDDLDLAEARLVTLGVSQLYVADPDGLLIGVLPDYELLKRRVAGDSRAQAVAELMSPIVTRATGATPVNELAVLMRDSGLPRIPVVAQGRLIGEVTRRDVLRWLRTGPTLDAAILRSGLPAGPKFLRSSSATVPHAGARVLGGIAIPS